MFVGLPDDDDYKKIWSSKALLEEKYHELVVKVHTENITAGAKWITTCSYGCNINYYSRLFDEDQVLEKMKEHAHLSAGASQYEIFIFIRAEDGKRRRFREGVCTIAHVPFRHARYRFEYSSAGGRFLTL